MTEGRYGGLSLGAARAAASGAAQSRRAQQAGPRNSPFKSGAAGGAGRNSPFKSGAAGGAGLNSPFKSGAAGGAGRNSPFKSGAAGGAGLNSIPRAAPSRPDARGQGTRKGRPTGNTGRFRRGPRCGSPRVRSERGCPLTRSQAAPCLEPPPDPAQSCLGGLC